jgi:DNA uptake protein ComE-like DNA-binding protein
MRTTRLGKTILAAIAAILLVVSAPADAKTKDPAKAPAAARVDLNSASQADLEALPGVGSATAKKIIAGRPFSSVQDLSRAGVSAATIDKLKPLVKAGRGSSAAAEPAKETKTAAAPKEEKAAKAVKETKSEVKAPASAAASGARVDLNTASEKGSRPFPPSAPRPRRRSSPGGPTSVADLRRPAFRPRRSKRSAPS